MGRLALVLSTMRDLVRGVSVPRVKVDPGGGANSICGHFQGSGEDAPPLPGDYVILVPGNGTGRFVVVGALDAKNVGEADPGERRVYGRDSDGDIVNVVWLKASGEVEVANSLGGMTLGSNGTVTINGVTIDPSGNISAASVSADSVVADGNELAGHVHFVSGTPGNTGPNL